MTLFGPMVAISNFTQKCKQTPVSQKLSMLKKFVYIFFASYEVPKLFDDKKFWGAKSGPPSPATSVNQISHARNNELEYAKKYNSEITVFIKTLIFGWVSNQLCNHLHNCLGNYCSIFPFIDHCIKLWIITQDIVLTDIKNTKNGIIGKNYSFRYFGHCCVWSWGYGESII